MNNNRSVLASPMDSSNVERELVDKLAPVIHADLLCINEIDRKEILDQVDMKSFTEVKSMSDLWSVELLIIGKLTPADLVARLWLVRQKFHSKVGDAIYQNYIASLADELSEAEIKKLVTKEFSDQKSLSVVALKEAISGDITNLTRQLQRLSYYKFLRLDTIYKIKKNILRILFVILLLMFGSLFLLYGYDPLFSTNLHPEHFSLVVSIIFSGMVGSCMSLLQRTEKASNAPSHFTDSVLDAMDIKLSMSIPYILSLILSGAIFATILYLLAVSGSFELGILFPKLELLPTGGGALSNDLKFCEDRVGIRALYGCVTLNPKNAMILVWAFMAGFAERLVPDALDSLVEKAQKPKT